MRDDGHDAYPLTPTGLGERVHLASPEVDLDTHIIDVVNLIEFADLHDVVLLDLPSEKPVQNDARVT